MSLEHLEKAGNSRGLGIKGKSSISSVKKSVDGLALSLLDEVSNIGSVRSLDKTIILEINYTTGTGLTFNRRRTTCECVYLEVIGAKNGMCDRSFFVL